MHLEYLSWNRSPPSELTDPREQPQQLRFISWLRFWSSWLEFELYSRFFSNQKNQDNFPQSQWHVEVEKFFIHPFDLPEIVLLDGFRGLFEENERLAADKLVMKNILILEIAWNKILAFLRFQICFNSWISYLRQCCWATVLNSHSLKTLSLINLYLFQVPSSKFYDNTSALLNHEECTRFIILILWQRFDSLIQSCKYICFNILSIRWFTHDRWLLVCCISLNILYFSWFFGCFSFFVQKQSPK